MGRLSLTASTANVNPANTVGIESLDRIEKLMVERFATTQSMIFKNAKALDALALEISLIKASVKEMRLGMENLTAAISIHAAVNKPAPAMKASEPVKADSGNALADLINNALDFTALRAIAKDNKPRFDDIVLARNTAQWDKSKLSNNLEAAKVNMLSKLAGTSAKANESVKENPVESWSKQLKLSADLLKQIVESVRKNGFQESDKEEIGEFLGHNNLPIAFFAWLKSVSESARK